MGLVLLGLVVGLLAGLATGGRLRELAALPFPGAPLLLGAVVVQLLGLALARVLAPGVTWGLAIAVSAALVGAFLLVNRSVAGTALIALGLLTNAVVILANGAMPVSAYAAARSGVGVAAVNDARHAPQTSSTRLSLLGDLVPVPLPVRPEVDSVGDLMVAAGVGQLLFCAVRPRRRRYLPDRAYDGEEDDPLPAEADPAKPAPRSRSVDTAGDSTVRTWHAGRDHE